MEKWYKGDFKKKYPKGVLCWIWKDYPYSPIHKRVVVDFDSRIQRFKTDTGTWVYAKPVKPEEAPAIIKKEQNYEH